MNNKYTKTAIIELIKENNEIDTKDFNQYMWLDNKEIWEIIWIKYNENNKKEFAKILQYFYVNLNEESKIKLIKIIELDQDFFFFTNDEIKKHSIASSWIKWVIARINWDPDIILYEENIWNFYFNNEIIQSDEELEKWNIKEKIKYNSEQKKFSYNNVSYSISWIKELIKFMEVAHKKQWIWFEKEELKNMNIDIERLKNCLRKTLQKNLWNNIPYKTIFPHFTEKKKEFIMIIG